MKRDALPATPIRYLSLFSGIEAATVAWAPLGWVCVGVAEIENFPLRVLAHHYPNVPKLGDITKITEADIAALGRIDVMVFGSPCQDMSVAGKRKGMLNADGTVTRSGLFFAAFNIFQWARKHGGCRFALWENVPGAYSSSQGRDFASVVELLAGLDDVAVPVNGWGTEGCALGDNGLLEWACLDAQWFGVAQRRRRVFAVLDTGNWSSRGPILLERQSLRGDFAPRRETGQDVAGTLSSRTTGGGGFGTDFEIGGGFNQYSLGNGVDLRNGAITGQVAHTVQAGQHAPDPGGTPHVLAFDARQDCVSSTEVFGSLGSSSPQAQAIAFSCKDHGADATIELAPTMRAMGHAASHANAGGQLAVCITPIDMLQASRGATMTNNRKEGSSGGAPGTGIGNAGDPSPTISTSHVPAVCITGDVTHCLKAEGFDASEDGTGRGQPIVAATREVAGCVTSNYGKQLDNSDTALGPNVAIHGMAVRRLTPTETERLQGFPDGYTAIPIRKYARKRVTKLRPESMWAQIDGNWWLLAADGPRYKSHGNSFAVPVINWIGKKIQSAMEVS